MNGVHDIGGMHGFGLVPTEDSGTFHTEWERTVFALNILLRVRGVYELDEMRHSRERLNPAEVLQSSYFERWLLSIEQLLLEKDVLTAAEIDDKIEAINENEATVPENDDPGFAAKARQAFEDDSFSEQEWIEPRFAPGDEVIVKNQHPRGHTRAPRYVRRARGVVEKVHGTFQVADAVAHGRDESEPLYLVRFSGEELWSSEHTSTDELRIDMWERYLTTGPVDSTEAK